MPYELGFPARLPQAPPPLLPLPIGNNVNLPPFNGRFPPPVFVGQNFNLPLISQAPPPFNGPASNLVPQPAQQRVVDEYDPFCPSSSPGINDNVAPDPNIGLPLPFPPVGPLKGYVTRQEMTEINQSGRGYVMRSELDGENRVPVVSSSSVEVTNGDDLPPDSNMDLSDDDDAGSVVAPLPPPPVPPPPVDIGTIMSPIPPPPPLPFATVESSYESIPLPPERSPPLPQVNEETELSVNSISLPPDAKNMQSEVSAPSSLSGLPGSSDKPPAKFKFKFNLSMSSSAVCLKSLEATKDAHVAPLPTSGMVVKDFRRQLAAKKEEMAASNFSEGNLTKAKSTEGTTSASTTEIRREAKMGRSKSAGHVGSDTGHASDDDSTSSPSIKDLGIVEKSVEEITIDDTPFVPDPRDAITKIDRVDSRAPEIEIVSERVTTTKRRKSRSHDDEKSSKTGGKSSHSGRKRDRRDSSSDSDHVRNPKRSLKKPKRHKNSRSPTKHDKGRYESRERRRKSASPASPSRLTSDKSPSVRRPWLNRWTGPEDGAPGSATAMENKPSKSRLTTKDDDSYKRKRDKLDHHGKRSIRPKPQLGKGERGPRVHADHDSSRSDKSSNRVGSSKSTSSYSDSEDELIRDSAGRLRERSPSVDDLARKAVKKSRKSKKLERHTSSSTHRRKIVVVSKEKEKVSAFASETRKPVISKKQSTSKPKKKTSRRSDAESDSLAETRSILSGTSLKLSNILATLSAPALEKKEHSAVTKSESFIKKLHGSREKDKEKRRKERGVKNLKPDLKQAFADENRRRQQEERRRRRKASPSTDDRDDDGASSRSDNDIDFQPLEDTVVLARKTLDQRIFDEIGLRDTARGASSGNLTKRKLKPEIIKSTTPPPSEEPVDVPPALQEPTSSTKSSGPKTPPVSPGQFGSAVAEMGLYDDVPSPHSAKDSPPPQSASEQSPKVELEEHLSENCTQDIVMDEPTLPSEDKDDLSSASAPSPTASPLIDSTTDPDAGGMSIFDSIREQVIPSSKQTMATVVTQVPLLKLEEPAMPSFKLLAKAATDLIIPTKKSKSKKERMPHLPLPPGIIPVKPFGPPQKTREEKLAERKKRHLEKYLRSSEVSSTTTVIVNSVDVEHRRMEEVRKKIYRCKLKLHGKDALKSYFQAKKINKDQFKIILKKAVPKICKNTNHVNLKKVQMLIESYVKAIQKDAEKKGLKSVL